MAGVLRGCSGCGRPDLKVPGLMLRWRKNLLILPCVDQREAWSKIPTALKYGTGKMFTGFCRLEVARGLHAMSPRLASKERTRTWGTKLVSPSVTLFSHLIRLLLLSPHLSGLLCGFSVFFYDFFSITSSVVIFCCFHRCPFPGRGEDHRHRGLGAVSSRHAERTQTLPADAALPFCHVQLLPQAAEVSHS